MSSGPMTFDYDGIEERLQALSGLVSSIAPDLADWFNEYVDVGEYGLAVEIVAEVLRPDTTDSRVQALAAGLLAEARGMRLPDETIEPLEALARE